MKDLPNPLGLTPEELKAMFAAFNVKAIPYEHLHYAVTGMHPLLEDTVEDYANVKVRKKSTELKASWANGEHMDYARLSQRDKMAILRMQVSAMLRSIVPPQIAKGII